MSGSESAELAAPASTPPHDEAAEHLSRLLDALGVPKEHRDVRHLASAARAFRHLTRGYGQRPEDVIGDALFDESPTEAVVVRDIPFVSMCREHLLRFRGLAHVAYLPGGHVVGLSKLARLVDLFAYRLQTPSRLADDIARAVRSGLGTDGVLVRVVARQDCPGVTGTITSEACLGDFRLPAWRDRLPGLR